MKKSFKNNPTHFDRYDNVEYTTESYKGISEEIEEEKSEQEKKAKEEEAFNAWMDELYLDGLWD